MEEKKLCDLYMRVSTENQAREGFSLPEQKERLEIFCKFKGYIIVDYYTDAVKNYIVPTLTEKQKKFVYAEEADVLNVALFGMTAKEWRENNSKLAEDGNMRDYTDLLHLVILNNLENSNVEFIKLGISQSERLVKLNESARNQMEILKNNNGIKELEILQKQMNDNKKYLVESK